MRAKEGTFRDLVTQDRQFQIPLYQRHYRWRTAQQEDLWQDIAEQDRALAIGDSSVPRHFIGSVVAVEQEADPLYDFREFRIVDGQQRITTLSIALAALRDVASRSDPKQFERLSKKYLINDTESKGSARWARLVPGDEDSGPYRAILTGNASAQGQSAIFNAYQFFYRKMDALREAGEFAPERLATTIGDRLTLVFVTVMEGERPHKIFESINATGVGLSQSDLLRNYIFMALGSRSNAVYRQSWRPLEKMLGAEGLEGLVRDLLQSNGTFVKQSTVYRTAREEIERFAFDLDELERYVEHLSRIGEFYAALLNPESFKGREPELGMGPAGLRNLKFLRAWGASTTYPLLLKIFAEADAGRATSEQFDSCLEAIESFIVRRYLADVPTNALNRLFVALAGQVGSAVPVEVTVRRYLSLRGRWPSDERVKEGVRKVHYYSNGRAHQQRLVLERLESALRAEVDIDYASAQLSIEHIMPQTLSAEWKQAIKNDGDDPEDLFERLGHTLGNLTLTAWNSQLSNKMFERKKEILDNSELKLNDFLKAASKWGAGEIRERAEMLGALSVSLWSQPVAGVESLPSGFDWSRVDDALSALPAGFWTSYGDLADLAGTAAQPTANHVSRDAGVINAYRVLGSDGTVSFDFRWHESNDRRDPVEVLIGEGVVFDENLRADQSQRLRSADLEKLLYDGEIE